MQTKEKIISILRLNGPSLPVHIAKGTGLSILFASAFLSELFYEKKISISNLKVGSSPLYFIPGQEPQLERFAMNNLKSKEKEAFLLLKDRQFLKDDEQEPAIRVALREIKDFAIAFRITNEIYWRYFTIPQEEFSKKTEKEVVIEIKNKGEINEPIIELVEEDSEEEEESEDEEEQEEDLDVLEEKEEVKKIEKKKAKKRAGKKQDEQFFNKIKEFLSEKSIDIIDIQSFNKNDLAMKIKEDGEEKMLIAYNKKKIISTDLLKAYKKAEEANLPYIVLSLGEPAKKLKDLISAIKELSKIEKIE